MDPMTFLFRLAAQVPPPLFTPIAVSIFLITVGIGFKGTVFITAGMLLSVTYLLCGDADRIWAAIAALFAR